MVEVSFDHVYMRLYMVLLRVQLTCHGVLLC